MKKIAVFLAAFVAFATTQATAQQYYNVSPKWIYEHQVMDSTHVGVISVDTLLFNKTAATKDVNLYRASANRLRTGDSLTVDGNLTVTGTSTLTGTATAAAGVTLSGSASNVSLGSNFLSGDGGDEGVSVDASGNATLSGTSTHTGVASFANGTAALPPIAGINDPNTGIRFGGTDTLGFVTGGSDVMTVVGANVGIGTTTPGALLDIGSAVGTDREVIRVNNELTGGSFRVFSDDQGSNYNVDVDGGHVLQVGTRGGTPGWKSARFTGSVVMSTDAGSVGIGTTVPVSKLHVAGQVSVSPGTVANPSIADSSQLNTGINFVGNDSLGIVTNGTERIRVNASGNVGIGTTTPSNAGKLSVAGGVTIGVATTDTVLNAHHLRINNGGTFSEIVAGETAFDNVSDINVKQNIQSVDTDSIYSLVKAMNYPRKWQYKPSILRTQAEIDRINEATSDKTVTPIVEAKVDSLVKAKATGTFNVTTTQVPVVTMKKVIQSIKPEHIEVGLEAMDVAVLIPADTTWQDAPETTYVARYDTVYTCSASKRTQIRNAVLASQQSKATSELSAYEARIAKDAAIPHVSVMAQDMYPVSKLMKGDEAKETVLSGDNLINALLIAVKKQAEEIDDLKKRVTILEGK